MVFLAGKVLPWILFTAAVQGIIAAGLALTYTKLTGRSNILTMTSAELDERFGEEGLYNEQRVLLVMPFGPFLCLAAFEVLYSDGIFALLESIALKHSLLTKSL